MNRVSGMIFGILGVVLLVVAGLAGQGAATHAQEGDDDVRVMTYNIKHGQGNDDCEDEGKPEGTPSAAQCDVDLDRTADVIVSQESDIVALQEVDRSWARSGGVDQPTELVQALDVNACFGANLNHEPDEHADEPHQYGTLILSTYPILSCDNILLPTSEGWEQRGVLEVRVEIDGLGEVAILNTHLQAGREGDEEEAVRQRAEAADIIAERIAELKVPVILMGDFNAEPGDEELTSLRDPELGLQDAWQVAGDEDSEGYTSPASLDKDAERRIDAIFVSDEIEVRSADVPVTDDTRIASDHFPVVADLTLESGTPVVDEGITPESTLEDVTPEPTSAVEAPATEPALIVAPTMEPVEEATPIQSEVLEPTIEPTVTATEEPEAESTDELEPTEDPEPTAEPSAEPQVGPTEEPEPTMEPAGESSVDPAEEATGEPAEEVTAEPAG